MTLKELQTLLADPDYLNIPITLADSNNLDSDGWSSTLSSLMEEGVKVLIWEATQYVVLLFDTYGKLINSVEFEFDTIENQQDLFISLKFRINNQLCDIDGIEMEDEELEKFRLVDSLNAIDFLFSGIEERIVDDRFLYELRTIKGALNRTFSNPQEASDVAQTVAPEIEAFVRSWRLTHIAQVSGYNQLVGEQIMTNQKQTIKPQL